MKVVIVEDETAATVNLKHILGEVCPDCEIVATIETIKGAVEWFMKNPHPDVVFMDIHLADGDAFKIFEKIYIDAPVIFTTAYDMYALEAFKVNSIDYILKPIKAADVEKSLEKLRRLSRSEVDVEAKRISEAILNQRTTDTFLIAVRDKLIPVKVEDIAFFYTTDEKVSLYDTQGQSYPYDKSLDAVITTLPAADFFRANRQFIIARRSIKDISVWFGNRLAVNMTVPEPEKIIISKARVPEFKKWLTGMN